MSSVLTTADAMDVFETRLRTAWEHDALAMLAATLTFDGACQWVFYTDDVDECHSRLHAMPQERERYPIELTAAEDPDWDYLRDQVLGHFDWEAHQVRWERQMVEQ